MGSAEEQGAFQIPCCSEAHSCPILHRERHTTGEGNRYTLTQSSAADGHRVVLQMLLLKLLKLLKLLQIINTKVSRDARLTTHQQQTQRRGMIDRSMNRMEETETVISILNHKQSSKTEKIAFHPFSFLLLLLFTIYGFKRFKRFKRLSGSVRFG